MHGRDPIAETRIADAAWPQASRTISTTPEPVSGLARLPTSLYENHIRRSEGGSSRPAVSCAEPQRDQEVRSNGWLSDRMLRLPLATTLNWLPAKGS
jgi:hypothetical protein